MALGFGQIRGLSLVEEQWINRVRANLLGDFVRLYVRSVRTTGLAFPNLIGSAIASRTLTAGSTGGFYCSSEVVPLDIRDDLASTLRLVVDSDGTSALSDVVVVWSLTFTIVRNDTISNTTIRYEWDTPDAWSNGNPRIVQIPIPANTFQASDRVGFLITRQGGDAADTFDQSVRLSEVLNLFLFRKRYDTDIEDY